MDREKDGVRWFLGKWLEVELVDGRIITGLLACTDREPNIVLSKAEERWDRAEQPRHIGLAMVARKNVKKILLLPAPPASFLQSLQEQPPLPSESPEDSEE